MIAQSGLVVCGSGKGYVAAYSEHGMHLFGLFKMRGIFRLLEKVLASQEGLHVVS
jgi:hypothetical protein